MNRFAILKPSTGTETCFMCSEPSVVVLCFRAPDDEQRMLSDARRQPPRPGIYAIPVCSSHLTEVADLTAAAS